MNRPDVPAVPAGFKPLAEPHFRALAACLSNIETPRFIGVFMVARQRFAIHTGHTVESVAGDNTRLADCLAAALAAFDLQSEKILAVIDRNNGRAWTARYNDAAQFLAAANPSPEQIKWAKDRG